MERLTVGLSSDNYFNMPFWIAQREGFFADESLDVTGVRYESEAQNVAWLDEGTTQYTFINAETVLSDIDRGKPTVMIGGNVQTLPFRLIARPEIDHPEDLRGKTIGVSSLGVGTSTILRDYLDRFDLTYQKDYRMVPIGMIRRRWAALQSGEIDAGMQGTPMDLLAVEAGFHDLGDITSGLGAYQFVALGAVRPFAAAHRELTIRVLAAFARAYSWFSSNRDASIPIAVRETGMTARHAAATWERFVTAGAFPPDGDVSPDGLRTVIRLSARVRGLGEREMSDWQRYVDRSYFLEATTSERATARA